MSQRNIYANKQIKKKLHDNITAELQLFLLVIDKQVVNLHGAKFFESQHT